MLKHTKPICHHINCFVFLFILFFSTNKGRFLWKFTCRDLVNCFLQFKSKKPGFPGHQEAGSPESNQSAWHPFDWHAVSTNQPIASFFTAASNVAAITTYNFKRSRARLTRQKSTEIWQLHRWDNRLGAVLLIASVFLFSWSTTHCEPGVVTVKKQPLEVQPFRQHEQKEKGLEDWKR